MKTFWILTSLLLDVGLYGEVSDTSNGCITNHRHSTCVLINYMDINGDGQFESVFLTCDSRIQSFSRSNLTLSLNDTNVCGKHSSCRVAYDNEHPNVCNPLNIRIVYLLSPTEVLLAKYGECSKQMNWAQWGECDRGIQQRYRYCTGQNPVNMKVKLCDNHVDSTSTFLSSVNSKLVIKSVISLQPTSFVTQETIHKEHSTVSMKSDVVEPHNPVNPGCRITSTCILINYIDLQQNFQTLYLKCHGSYSAHYRHNRTLFLKWYLKEDCSITPRCVITRTACVSSDVRFFMNKNIMTSVIYSACQDSAKWSCWFRMEKDFEYRVQNCVNGTVKKFQIRIYQGPASTSCIKSSYVAPFSSYWKENTKTSNTNYQLSTTFLHQSFGRSSIPTVSSLLRTTKYKPSSSMLTSAKLASSSIQLFCRSVEEGDAAYKGRYKFAATKLHFTVTLICRYGNREKHSSLNITRTCKVDINGYPYWETLNLTMCSAKSSFSNHLLKLLEVNMTSSNAPSVVSHLKNILGNRSARATPSDVENTAIVIEKCVVFATGDKNMTHQLFDSIQTLMDFDVKTLNGKKTHVNSLLSNLDKLSRGLVKLNESVSFSSNNLGFAKTNLSTQKNLYIASNSVDSNVGLTFQELTSHSGDSKFDDGAILIPNSVWRDRNVSSFVYSFVFRNDKLFRTRTSNEYHVASKIISATIYEADIQNATSPIKISFTVPKSNNVYCSFWQDSHDVHNWSTKGCYLYSYVEHAHKTSVTCACNHLTNFAILLSPESANYNPPELQFFSLVGCIISISALSATIVVYLFFRDLHKSVPQQIFINFSCSLFALLFTFTLGVDNRRSASLCHKISALLHYFTLTTFMWMGAECISLYESVVKVFRSTNRRKNVWLPMIIAWGVPAIAASVTSKYSRRQFDERPEFCVVKGDLYLFTTFLPVTTILVFNLILFIPIMRQIHGHLSTKERMQQKTDYMRRTRVTLSCMVLLGLTWMFGLFAIKDLTVPLQWIFTILNSFQGLFIFLFHVVLKYEVQQAVKKMFGYRFQRYSFSSSSRFLRTTGTVKLSKM